MAKRSRIDTLIAELEGKRNILNAQIDALREAAKTPTSKLVRKSKSQVPSGASAGLQIPGKTTAGFSGEFYRAPVLTAPQGSND